VSTRSTRPKEKETSIITIGFIKTSLRMADFLMQNFILLTISSENSSADIAYFPRNFLLTNEIDGTAWPASASGELDC